MAAREGTWLSVLLLTWDDALASRRGDRDDAWYDAVLPAGLERRFCQRAGCFAHEAIEHAKNCDARIVVLASATDQSPTTIAAIATVSGVPVLVAQEPRSGDVVVVATDLCDPHYPVVRRAADMIDHVETTLVGIHNIDDTVTDAELARRRAALATALDPLSMSPELVIDHNDDSASAVLAAARERDADIIVVGARRRTWLDCLARPSVASRVLAKARRSVLIAPLDQASPPRGPSRTLD